MRLQIQNCCTFIYSITVILLCQRKSTGYLDKIIVFYLFSCIISIKQVIFLKYGIGNKIRKYRKENGLTQEQLADKINVTKSRVSNWEQGINRPDADIIGNICRTLNVSPSDLLDVHLTDDELNVHEKKVIKAYRTKKDLQQAVDILLGIDDNAAE